MSTSSLETSQQDQENDVIYLDDNILNSIVKFQALVRGFLTRKAVRELLQQLVMQQQQEELNSDEENCDEMEVDSQGQWIGQYEDHDHEGVGQF